MSCLANNSLPTHSLGTDWYVIVGEVHSAREQDSSIGGDASNVCLGVVYMEEEVQVRVQVEVGREEKGEGVSLAPCSFLPTSACTLNQALIMDDQQAAQCR